MNKTIWVYWEDLNKTEPAYITLSRMSMLHNLTDCSLIVVTPDNVEKYLPGINAITKKIEVDIQGRADRFFRKFQNNRKNIAVKCDVIRAFLLEKYGGIYIDSDAIIFDDLTSYFEKLKQKDFFIVKRSSHGKSHCSVGFYGCLPNSSIITQYVNEIKARLNQSTEVAYNDLGAALLTPIVDKFITTAEIISEKEVQPVTFEDARKVFIDQSMPLDNIITANQKIFMLFNGPFANELKGISIESLYNSNYLISKAFRKAIPEVAFSDFYNRLK